MKQLTKMIGSLTAKFAALLLTLGLAGGAWANPVAKVGTTEYETIDEAIAAWTANNNSTMTLLADVTLSNVIQLKSTEMHTLELGTYTMTAASGKNAIQVLNYGRTSPSYALDIKADATNPGGISAPGYACVYYKHTEGSVTTKDRPIIRIYGGNFSGKYCIQHGTSNGTNCPQFYIYGGTFTASGSWSYVLNTNRSVLQISGGTFNGALNCSVDQSAYAMISGGKFSDLSRPTWADLWEGVTKGTYEHKWLYATSKVKIPTSGSPTEGTNPYDVDITVDADGYYIVSKPVIPTAKKLETFSASLKQSLTTSSTFYYSNVRLGDDSRLYYATTERAMDALTDGGDIELYTDCADNKKLSKNTTKITLKNGATYSGTITLSGINAIVVIDNADGTSNAQVVSSVLGYVPSKSVSGSATTISLVPESEAVAIVDDTYYYSDLHAALEAGKAAGSVVKLLQDINLVGVNWEPVGTTESPFSGSIDGNGKTISNLTVNNQNLDYAGLIGYGNGTGSGTKTLTIKDLTIANASITARMYAGVLGGCLYSYNSINNVKVQGLIQVTGNYKVGGVVGGGYIHAYGSSIAGDEGSFVKGLYLGAKGETVNDSVLPDDCEGDNVGGFIGHMGEGAGVGLYNCSSSGLTVMGSRKVGGLVGTLPPENTLENVNVDDITVGTTATAAYANDNKSTMEIGGVVGSYYNNGTGGVISGTVQGITIAELPEGITGTGDGKNISYGLVTGGNRGANPELKLTWSGLTATGYDPAKYNNAYLLPKVAQVGDVQYVTFEEAIDAADAGNVNEITILNGATESPHADWKISDGKLIRKIYVAQIGETKYETFAAALDAVKDGETITVLDVAGNESGTEINFDRESDIAFKITGTAPNYRPPIITFADEDGSGGKITVTIEDATLAFDELDARQNATVNVVDSFIDGKGGNTIVKSYFNGAINISGTSKVYTMQVTTMGYITISDSATLTATWQANVYGNGLISVNPGATFNTAALNLTGQAYLGRDNTDVDRVGKPAAVIVDGATLNVGVNAYSSSGADYNYNSTAYGINIGTVDGKSAILDIKNDSTVVLAQGSGSGSGKFGGKVSFGVGATVKVTDGSSLTVQDRGSNGVTLTNGGTIALDVTSSVVTPGFASTSGLIDIDSTGLTQPVKVIDYTGAGTMALADYGTVTVTSGETYAEANDLWVKRLDVAQIGTTKYASLAEAILAAQDGDTIEILDGTWGADAVGVFDEPGKYTNAQAVRAKSLTIQAAEGAKPKFTADVKLGYEDSKTANATMTVKGLAFENAKLSLVNYVQATVEDCTFTGSGANAALFVGDSCDKNHLTSGDYPADQVTIKDCTFDGTAAGSPAIRVRNGGNVTVTGNTVANSAHNGILLESNTAFDNTAVKTVTITGNTITEWNAGNVAEGGRGIRASLGGLADGSTVTVEGNVFRKTTTGLDEPDFAKITGAGGAAVDISGNDWNDMLLSEVKDNDAVYTSDATTTTITSVITTRKEPVAQIGEAKYETLQDAVDAAHEMTGDVTVEFVADELSGYAIVHQKAGLNLTIDGKGKTLHGQIIVDGDNRSTGTETLTIKDVVFEGDNTHFHSGTDAFVLVPGLKTSGTDYYNNKNNYAHNITIDGCTFTSTSASAEKDVVGFKSSSGGGTAYNVAIRNTTGSNLHSLAQFNPVEGSAVYNCSITDSESFVNVSNGKGSCSIEKCTFSSTLGGYAVRENGFSTTTVILKDNDFSSTNANNEPGNVLVIGKGDSATAGTIKVVDGFYNGDLVKTAAATGNFEITGGRFSVEVPEAYCGKDAGGNQLYPIAGLYPDTPATPNGVGPDTVAVAIVTQGDPATTTRYVSLAAALNAARVKAAGGWNTTSVTVDIISDITFAEGDEWTPVLYNQANPITINGNGNTIKNLPGMLYDKQGSGVSTLTINNLTFEDAKVSVSGDYAAVIMGYADSVVALTFNNVTIKNATVSSGKYAGAFVGYAAGYDNASDGPVYQHVTFNNCAVIDSKLTGVGSVGALMGHASGSTDSKVVVTDTTVTGNTITCTGEGKTNLAGALFGTVGNLGPVNKPDAGIYVTATVSGNTVKSDGTTITTIYGRQGSTHGTLIMTPGGSYDAPPIAETDSAWASCIEDYEVTESNGIYSVTRMPPVAKICDTTYTSLQKALNAAHEMTGDVTVELVADITEVAVIHQKAGLNLTLDGAEKTITGQIYIDGDARYWDTDTLTIQNTKFAYDASTYDDAFIDVPKTSTAGKPYTTGKYNYAHNVTVRNCEFAGSGETTVAFRVASGAGANGVVLNGLKAEGGHSFAQLVGVKELTITDCKITGTMEGINISGGKGTGTISGTTLTTTGGYTVRLKDVSEMSVTLVDNTFNGAAGIISSATNGGKITVNSGSYVGALDSSAGKLVITGGRFSVEVPEAYCGKDAYDNELHPIAGLYPDTPATPNGVGPDTVAVAIVTQGDPATTTRYGSLAAAVAAVADNGTATITMLAADTLAEYVAIPAKKNIKLDLNGQTVTATNGGLDLYGTLQVVDGTTDKEGKFTAGTWGIWANPGADLLVSSGTVEGGKWAIVAQGAGTMVKVEGGKVYSKDGTAISGIGNSSDSGYTIEVAGGEVVSDTDIAIYHPNGTKLTVSGGTVSGATAIYQKAGTLEITGGTIAGTGDATGYVFNDNGANATGDALVVENCGYPNGAPVVSITGGTFRSTNAKAVGSYAKDSTFTALTGFISPTGTALFSDDVSDGVPAGYELVPAGEDYDGLYKLAPLTGILYVTGKDANGKNRGVMMDVKWLNKNGFIKGDVATQEELDGMQAALSESGKNGLPYWQSYVLGVDPNGTYPLTIAKGVSSGENYIITGKFAGGKSGFNTVNDTIFRVKPSKNATMTVEFTLVQRGAFDADANDWTWSEVESATQTASSTNTAPQFTVPMDKVANKVLAISVTIMVDDKK